MGRVRFSALGFSQDDVLVAVRLAFVEEEVADGGSIAAPEEEATNVRSIATIEEEDFGSITAIEEDEQNSSSAINDYMAELHELDDNGHNGVSRCSNATKR